MKEVVNKPTIVYVIFDIKRKDVIAVYTKRDKALRLINYNPGYEVRVRELIN